MDTFACASNCNAPPALHADLHSVWRIPSADCPATFAEGPNEMELMPPSNGAVGCLKLWCSDAAGRHTLAGQRHQRSSSRLAVGAHERPASRERCRLCKH